jgi:hypothetical protein
MANRRPTKNQQGKTKKGRRISSSQAITKVVPNYVPEDPKPPRSAATQVFDVRRAMGWPGGQGKGGGGEGGES